MDWLAKQRGSMAFTTYQTGKLFLIGRKQDQSIAIFELTFGHCMEMRASRDASTTWLSLRHQIWKFSQPPTHVVPHQPPDPENIDSAIPAYADRRYDVANLPRVGHTTGHLDAHDMAIDEEDQLWPG